MNYDETLHYLYNALPVFHKIGGAAYKEGLDNTLALDERFNHPHTHYKTIHIAGTNGKGSISHTLLVHQNYMYAHTSHEYPHKFLAESYPVFDYNDNLCTLKQYYYCFKSVL